MVPQHMNMVSCSAICEPFSCFSNCGRWSHWKDRVHNSQLLKRRRWADAGIGTHGNGFATEQSNRSLHEQLAQLSPQHFRAGPGKSKCKYHADKRKISQWTLTISAHRGSFLLEKTPPHIERNEHLPVPFRLGKILSSTKFFAFNCC